MDPIRPTTSEARALARALLLCRHGALAVTDEGAPHVGRVAVGFDGGPLLLVSGLARHARALRADPRCALLLGEAPAKGDPLAGPRLTLRGRVEAADKAGLRDLWLDQHPKARLYYDLADFALLRLVADGADLNGGFGQAFRLGPEDLRAP